MKKYERIYRVSPSGHGHYNITVEYYGRLITATTSDMPTLDKYKSDERGWKTAGNNLYDFVVRSNVVV